MIFVRRRKDFNCLSVNHLPLYFQFIHIRIDFTEHNIPTEFFILVALKVLRVWHCCKSGGVSSFVTVQWLSENVHSTCDKILMTVHVWVYYKWQQHYIFLNFKQEQKRVLPASRHILKRSNSSSVATLLISSFNYQRCSARNQFCH
jgi:hypothetical protein